MDLAPVVGSNLNFFGEHSDCKVLIEDIYAEVERHAREQKLAELPAFLSRRFRAGRRLGRRHSLLGPAGLSRSPAAQALAEQLTRAAQAGRCVAGVLRHRASRATRTTRATSSSTNVNLKHRPYPASRGRQAMLANRDIIRLFERLRVSDSFLLQNNLREILFRKPTYETR